MAQISSGQPRLLPASPALNEIQILPVVVDHRTIGESLVLDELVAEAQHTLSAAPASMLRDIKLVSAERGAYVVHSVTSASIYDRLGLQSGDVVFDIDKLIDLQFPGEALENFKDREVRFEIFRDGYPILVSYRIDL